MGELVQQHRHEEQHGGDEAQDELGDRIDGQPAVAQDEAEEGCAGKGEGEGEQRENEKERDVDLDRYSQQPPNLKRGPHVTSLVPLVNRV